MAKKSSNKSVISLWSSSQNWGMTITCAPQRSPHGTTSVHLGDKCLPSYEWPVTARFYKDPNLFDILTFVNMIPVYLSCACKFVNPA